MTRISIAQAQEMGLDIPKESKYKSKKVEVDGIQFHSQKEANKYKELLLEKRTGTILGIELQPKFELQPGFRDSRTGKRIRPIIYIADFRVTYKDGRVVVIDTKGFKTKEYAIKKKLFLRKYPEVDFVEE